jgi:hypothetical protein
MHINEKRKPSWMRYGQFSSHRADSILLKHREKKEDQAKEVQF